MWPAWRSAATPKDACRACACASACKGRLRHAHNNSAPALLPPAPDRQLRRLTMASDLLLRAAQKR
jgi:hypothetical protein